MGALALALALGSSVAQERAQSGGPEFRAQRNMACGLAPLPPLGCRLGPCVCDQQGRNCKWTFVGG